MKYSLLLNWSRRVTGRGISADAGAPEAGPDVQGVVIVQKRHGGAVGRSSVDDRVLLVKVGKPLRRGPGRVGQVPVDVRWPGP